MSFKIAIIYQNPDIWIEYFQDNVIHSDNPDRLGFPSHPFLRGDEFK